jgi:hypothetical protein
LLALPVVFKNTYPRGVAKGIFDHFGDTSFVDAMDRAGLGIPISFCCGPAHPAKKVIEKKNVTTDMN